MERKLVVETKIRMLKENIKAKHTQEKKLFLIWAFPNLDFRISKKKNGTPLPGFERFIFF